MRSTYFVVVGNIPRIVAEFTIANCNTFHGYHDARSSNNGSWNQNELSCVGFPRSWPARWAIKSCVVWPPVFSFRIGLSPAKFGRSILRIAPLIHCTFARFYPIRKLKTACSHGARLKFQSLRIDISGPMWRIAWFFGFSRTLSDSKIDNGMLFSHRRAQFLLFSSSALSSRAVCATFVMVHASPRSPTPRARTSWCLVSQQPEGRTHWSPCCRGVYRLTSSCSHRGSHFFV